MPLSQAIYETVVDRYFQALARFAYRTRAPFVIGVTGSVGKSTTTAMLAALLKDTTATAFDLVLTTQMNMNNNRGLPLSLLGYQDWPKGRRDLLRRLSAAPVRALQSRRLPAERRAAVLEFAAGPHGDLPRLTRLVPLDIGVVTAIGPAHLDTFGSVQGVAAVKGALVEAVKSEGLVVLGRDNPFLEEMQARARARTVVVDGAGRELARNIGLAVAKHLRVPPQLAARALAAAPGLPERLEVIRTPALVIINDAFNANPLSMALGLQHLSRLGVTSARRVAILGDMAELGGDAARYHVEMGNLAHTAGDLVIGIGTMAAHYRPARLYARWEDCADELQTFLRAGDCVLVKGSHSVGLASLIPVLRRLGKELAG